MTIPEFCEVLKDCGIVEVILEDDSSGKKLPTLVIAGLNFTTNEHFNLEITNEDFAKCGL